MVCITKLFRLLAALLYIVVLSPSLRSFPPAQAIRSSYGSLHSNVQVIRFNDSLHRFSYSKSPHFDNAKECNFQHQYISSTKKVCDPSLIHIATTLDVAYLRGSVAAVYSVLQHSPCPGNIFFHFLVTERSLASLVRAIFPSLKFRTYYFDPKVVQNLISSSIRGDLEQPLNYARNYLSDLLDPCVHRVIYLDSDLIVIDDISKLWSTNLGTRTIGAPEYCHTNFTKYFTENFWSEKRFSSTLNGQTLCYFNTGVMVIDLDKWRRFGYTQKIEQWMEIQKIQRIYELGSLPPYLLVFAGRVALVEHRWNQHGLGGDNVKGSCRDLHPGPVSLLHWSGSGKPWLRLDSNRSCPLDALWALYDLYKPSS